jgi:hypothetical protein
MEDKIKKLAELEKKREQISKKLALVKRSMILNERKADAHMKICIGVSAMELIKESMIGKDTADLMYKNAQDAMKSDHPAWQKLQELREGLKILKPQKRESETFDFGSQN